MISVLGGFVAGVLIAILFMKITEIIQAIANRVTQLESVFAWQRPVASFENDPPASPAAGDRYLVDDTPTGDWVGHEGEVAEWDGDAAEWVFHAPEQGWVLKVTGLADFFFHDGTAWENLPSTLTHNLLDGLQGGSSTERYHLTEAQRDDVTGATSADTSEAIVKRDAAGRAKVASGASPSDIARLDDVSAVANDLLAEATARRGLELRWEPELATQGDLVTPSEIDIFFRNGILGDQGVDREASVRVRLCDENGYDVTTSDDAIAVASPTVLLEEITPGKDIVVRGSGDGEVFIDLTHDGAGTRTIRVGPPPIGGERADYTNNLNVTV